MKSNYTAIIEQNLLKLYTMDLNERSMAIEAACDDRVLTFKAFGQTCTVAPDGISLDDQPQSGPLGVILSLYALNAIPAPCCLQPLQSFKSFPNSAPYVGAFATHTEQILVPAVEEIIKNRSRILDAMSGEASPEGIGGDATLVVHPLPKIALCYIFYEADEDFAPGATCLFSNNARSHMPLDGLADVGEYTSRAILNLVQME